MNFSGSVGRINLILFALDSVNQAASFDYNKPIIKDTLNFYLKGGANFGAFVLDHFLSSHKTKISAIMYIHTGMRKFKKIKRMSN